MTEADEKICPYCAETIKSAAIICRFCSRDLSPKSSSAVKAKPVQSKPVVVSFFTPEQQAENRKVMLGCLIFAFVPFLLMGLCISIATVSHPSNSDVTSGTSTDSRSMRQIIADTRKSLDEQEAKKFEDLSMPEVSPDGLKMSWVHKGGCMGFPTIKDFELFGKYKELPNGDMESLAKGTLYMDPATNVSIINSIAKPAVTLVRVNGGSHKGMRLYLPTSSIQDKNPITIDGGDMLRTP